MTNIDLSSLEILAASAETTLWQGKQALRLENGLALAPHIERLQDLCLEVSIGVEGAAYPGLAFRLQDAANFELAYPVPHVSGQWDAVQYDPVFLGSNTWQVYHGPAYQAAANVPTGSWFRLRLQVLGQRAAIRVDDQPPLVVEQLAHPSRAGRFGLWSYLPAYFCDFSVTPCTALDAPTGILPSPAPGALDAWHLNGTGPAACEPNGTLNLNRFLPAGQSPARLSRRFEVSQPGEVRFTFGFSDSLSLALDGQPLFSGERRFSGFDDRAARGYVELGDYTASRFVGAGPHTLSAEVGVQEPFGWGLALAAEGVNLSDILV